MTKWLIALFLFLSGLTAQSQPFTFVFLNKNDHKEALPKEEVDKLMAGHMANIKRLATEGKLVAAGPFEGGGGMFIFNSDSKTQVEEWLSTDPGVKAKRWLIEILPYKTQVGSVCSVNEPYEMTNYHFVRYGINITKFTISDLPSMWKEHEEFVKKLTATGNVIAAGNFGDQEGGILVLKGELSDGLIEQDPAVQKGFVEFEKKTLYIAKGAFCEK